MTKVKFYAGSPYQYYPNIKPIWGGSVKEERTIQQGQEYFRDQLSGNWHFVGRDFDFIENQQLTLPFKIELLDDNDVLIGQGLFTKTDCKFDYDNKDCTITIGQTDRYSRILEGLNAEYDLVALAPPLSEAKIWIRPIMQFYALGSTKLSNVQGTKSWDEEILVDPIVTSGDIIRAGFGSEPVAHMEYFVVDEIPIVQDSPFPGMPSRVFGVYDYEDSDRGGYMRFDNPAGRVKVYIPTNVEAGRYDILDIEEDEPIYYTEAPYAGQKVQILVSSSRPLDNNNPPKLTTQTASESVDLPYSQMIVYARWLSAKYDSGWGVRPAEDISSISATYRYYLPLTGDFNVGYDANDKLRDRVHISARMETEPTRWGRAETGNPDMVRYYAPIHEPTQYDGYAFLPMMTNFWGRKSIWIYTSDADTRTTNRWAIWEQDSAVQVKIRDFISIGNAIKRLLEKVDEDIEFEETSEYSQFLYAGANPISNIVQRLFITPISNIKSSYYDVAAQQGKISLANIFDMLRKCFKVYWYIDSSNKLHLEHIKYFMNGGTYSDSPRTPRIDLTALYSPRVGKTWAWGQNKVEYDLDGMYRRHTFGWTDNCTENFAGYPIEMVNSPWTSGEDTNRVDNFLSDIDYIIALPDEVSNDIWALVATDWSSDEGFVPSTTIPLRTISEMFWTGYPKKVTLIEQNTWLSFLYLEMMYWGYNISGAAARMRDLAFTIHSHKRFRKQTITLPFNASELRPAGAITYGLIKTDMGLGEVRKMSYNPESQMLEAEIYLESEQDI